MLESLIDVNKDFLNAAINDARKMIKLFFVDKDVDGLIEFLNPEKFTWVGNGVDDILTDIEDVRQTFKARLNIIADKYFIVDEDYMIGGSSKDSCIVIAKITFRTRDAGDVLKTMLHFSFYFQLIDGRLRVSHYHVHNPLKSVINLSQLQIFNAISDMGICIGTSMILYPAKRQVIIDGKPSDLTQVESAIMMKLVDRINESVPAEEFYRSIWNDAELKITSNTLRMHISNLRRKLRLDENSSVRLNFVDRGYCLSLR